MAGEPFIVVMGAPGAGKTTCGRLLAEKLNVPFADSDDLIERREGKSVRDIFVLHGEPYFRRLERELIEDLQLKSASGLDGWRKWGLGEGRSLVMSVGGGLPAAAGNVDLLKQIGFVVSLVASPAKLVERIGQNCARPLLFEAQQTGAMEARLEHLLAERMTFYSQADLVIDTDNLSPAAVVALILAAATLHLNSLQSSMD